jgi:hypothetical protein
MPGGLESTKKRRSKIPDILDVHLKTDMAMGGMSVMDDPPAL